VVRLHLGDIWNCALLATERLIPLGCIPEVISGSGLHASGGTGNGGQELRVRHLAPHS
jgi:hypothetical protein